MNRKNIEKILKDTAYVRTGGSSQELCCAEYLQSVCADMGLHAYIEPFAVREYSEECSSLIIDGKAVECKGYFGSACGSIKAKLYYLNSQDPRALKKCKDKIVLVDSAVRYSLYEKLLASGAKGFITYSGNINFPDKDIDKKEIRFKVDENNLLYAVNIHVSDALEMVRNGACEAEIVIKQEHHIGSSRNLILDLDGESEETIVISAHYDSTSLSTGAYDNMSGAIGLLYLAEYFSQNKHKRKIRLLWCGSEERGLLGSLAYCENHKDELKNIVMDINLDMVGCVMGNFVSFSVANDEMTEFLEKFSRKKRFISEVRYSIRSSDSSSFVAYGVPAVDFAHYAPAGTAIIHCRYDTSDMVGAKQLLDDMKYIAKFADHAANNEDFPVSRTISDKIKTDVENYMKYKRII